MIEVQYIGYSGATASLVFESLSEFIGFCKQYPDVYLPWTRVCSRLK